MRSLNLRADQSRLTCNDLLCSPFVFSTPPEKRILEPFWSSVHRRHRFVARHLFGTSIHLRKRGHIPFRAFGIRSRRLNIPNTLPLSIRHNLRSVLLRLTLVHHPSVVGRSS